MTGHWQVTTQKWVDGVGVVQPNVDANLPSDQYNAKDKNMNQLKNIWDDYRKTLKMKDKIAQH